MTVFLWLVACGPKAPPVAAVAPPPEPVGGPWEAPLGHEHPWLGRIWKPAEQRWATYDELVADLKGADYVLLGEKHDNPDGHRLQGQLVTAVGPKAVGFEMLDHADPIGEATDPESLRVASGWDESGWPEFAMYAPVFAATYGAGAAVVAAHPTKDEVRTAMREGFEALPAEATAGLRLDRPLTDADRASLKDEIEASHCGHAPAEVVDMMIRGQVLKDAWMARALEQAGPRSALIAGNGHTRNDRGVPHYLDGTTRSVSFLEVHDDDTDPLTIDEPADWVWFVPRVDDEDPCAAHAEALQKMGQPAPAPAEPTPAPTEPTPAP